MQAADTNRVRRQGNMLGVVQDGKVQFGAKVQFGRFTRGAGKRILACPVRNAAASGGNAVPQHAGPIPAPSRSPAPPRPTAAARPALPAIHSPSHETARFATMRQVLQLRAQEAAAATPSTAPPSRPASPDAKANRGGLPERLRAGVEALSGLAMDDVRVHRDSSEPARLGALAFTTGSDIHLGPGQEEHLPHEAWHAVQQKQGRVRPTTQFKGVAINDDAKLEHEADQISARISRTAIRPSLKPQCCGRCVPAVVQRQEKETPKKDKPPEKKRQAATATAPPPEVAVVLDSKLMTEAKVIAPGATVVRVSSIDELVTKLKTIKGPIKKLHFIGHMQDDGTIIFKSSNVSTYVLPADVAAAIKDAVKVEEISFQGCEIGQSPSEMHNIAGALSATKATGSNCSLVNQESDPVKVDGKPILKPGQLKDKKVRTAFEKGLKELREKFRDKSKKCIMNDTEEGYFKAGGKLFAYWANPASIAHSPEWDDSKSICYTDLKKVQIDPTQKIPVIDPEDCKLIEIEAKKP